MSISFDIFLFCKFVITIIYSVIYPFFLVLSTLIIKYQVLFGWMPPLDNNYIRVSLYFFLLIIFWMRYKFSTLQLILHDMREDKMRHILGVFATIFARGALEDPVDLVILISQCDRPIKKRCISVVLNCACM